MTICKFYQNGNCRNGNNCRFEHVNAGGGNNYRNGGQNRFGALGGGGGNNSQNPGDKYNITTDAIERDLTSETPQWILSAYAPGRDAPEQLFGGYPREQSFEEMRLHFMMGKASGNEQQALNEAQQLYSNAQQQMENAARNAQDAVQFLVSAENKTPNRLTICRDGTQGAPFGEFLVGKRPKSLVPDTSASSNPFGGNNNTNNTSSPFGGASTTSGSAFGQPSALGQRPSAFGTPSFGAPSQSAAPSSAFGQPSALGAKPNPFGTPSFGTPSQPTNNPGSAFGQPSQLGQKPNPFGSSASTGNNLSPFAASTNNNGGSSGFASASNNNNNNNNNNNGNNNNQSPFASASNNNNGLAPSPFGAPSGTQGLSPFSSNNNPQNNTNNTPSPFGQPSQAPSAFAQNNNPVSSNPFASSNQGPSSSNSNPFAQAQQPATGFANQPNQTNQQQASNPFNSTPMPNAGQQNTAQKPGAGTGNPYPPGSGRQHPPIESYSSKGMDGRLAMFKGKPVIYKDDMPGIRGFDGTWRRIWFPDGAPNYTKDTELPPDQYDEKSKAQWAAFQQTGTFQDGLMPELPPPRECTVWDF